MADSAVEVLLVEDNPNDVRLALDAFQQYRIANRVSVVRDGEEALEFLFCTGRYAHRSGRVTTTLPKRWPDAMCSNASARRSSGNERSTGGRNA